MPPAAARKVIPIGKDGRCAGRVSWRDGDRPAGAGMGKTFALYKPGPDRSGRAAYPTGAWPRDDCIHNTMKYLHRKIRDYLQILIRPGDRVLEVDPTYRLERLTAAGDHAFLRSGEIAEALPDPGPAEGAAGGAPDFLLANGALHYWSDIQERLSDLAAAHAGCDTRLVIVYYSQLWRPLIGLVTRLGLRKVRREMNWIAPEDLVSFSRISGWELLTDEQKVLVPIGIPLLSGWVNRFVAGLPLVRGACLLRIAVLRRRMNRWEGRQPSVSVVIPARNEAGNIRAALERVPLLSPADELIFVEGNSTDDTWDTIVALTAEQRYREKWQGRIRIARQPGKGKGDAVRTGFDLARGDILLILDADLTVAPEDLPKFYRAIVEDAGEFINGSRLVYPMERQAMRFFNIIGNKFFALAFSYVLGIRFKDTLCGTKVLSRAHYRKLAAHRDFFGDFDPFGDFDLLFGARRMGLRLAEVPIRYRERTYGDTNIQRWRHGVILLRMLLFAAGKIRFT